MKKIILSLLIATAYTFASYAQEKQDEGSFKPTSEYTTEVNFVPASGSMPISIDYLKLRMFRSENMAFRLGFNFAMHSENLKSSSTSATSAKTKNSYMLFGIVPGIEMHMGDMPKLSPYVGAELGFFKKSSKSNIELSQPAGNVVTIDSKGAWFDGANFSEYAYNQIGFNLLLGTDYYFSKHFFTGIEIGFGFNNTIFSEIKVTSTDTNIQPAVTFPKENSMDIGFNFQPAFRLGWAF